MYAIYFTSTMQPLWTAENKTDLTNQCSDLNKKFGFGAYVVGPYVQEAANATLR